MQVSPISNNQKTSFKAKLEVVGGTLLSKKPQQLLHKNALQRLEAKAKTIGTDKDTIFVGICNNTVGEPSPNLFLNMLGIPTYRIKEIRTKVTLCHNFPSKKSIDMPTENFISGDAKNKNYPPIRLSGNIWIL